MIKNILTHLTISAFAILTLIPLYFVVVNSFRSNTEIYKSFFGVPERISAVFSHHDNELDDSPNNEVAAKKQRVFEYYSVAWKVLKKYMLNTFFVSSVTALGVTLFGSITAYILARYRFAGRSVIYYGILSTMMIPYILTLVPSFMLVKWLGLLNSYSSLILPYIATGQVFAIFVFKEFFERLPEELFEAARIDGAGHFQLYVNVILPLSKPVIGVVVMMNVLGTWNNFLWPFITNTDERYHVIGSGLYVMAHTQTAVQMATMFSAYVLSSLPLLVLLIIATKPFMQGITSGSLKA